MVVVIVFLTLFVILSERSNAPDVAGDDTYPHYVCTFNSYCEGGTCLREPTSFVAYMSHAGGTPRLEIAGVNPSATITETPNAIIFSTAGGAITGDFSILPDRTFEFIGVKTTAEGNTDILGFGRCDRRRGG